MRGITFVLGILATTALTASAFAADKIGVVGAANGKVTVTREGKPVGVKAGDAVYLNDVFETAVSSEAQLIFVDRSTLTLTPKSKITVDTYVYDPATKDGQLALNGAKGVFRFVGGALSKQHPVSIKTPVATIGIRGGIAETHVSDTGATEAIFVYGDALTLTNQSGQTVTTNDFGSGIQLDTPTGAPVAMPGAVVVARLGETVASTGVGSTAETRALAPSDTVDQDLNTNSSTSTDSGDQGAAAPATESGGEGDDSSAPADGGSGNASNSEPASMSTPGAAEQALPPVIQVATVAPDVSTDKAIANTVATQLPPPVDTGSVPPPAGNTPVAPVAPTAPTDTANNGGGVTAPAYTHIGRYGIWENLNKEHGGTVSNYNAGANQYQGISTVVNSTTVGDIGTTNVFNVPDMATDGWNAINNFSIDGTENFSGEGYRTVGNAMQYYQLKGIDAGNISEYITMVQGTSAVNNLAAAAALTGVKFYSFLPDVMLERSAVQWGFFNYHTLEQSLTGDYLSAGIVPSYTKFGMVVDWTNKKYFGGVVNFLDTSTPDIHYAKALFGDVDLTGGVNQENYLNGYAYSFKGTDADAGGLNNASVYGVTKAGKEIYATAGNPISGMVLNYDVTDGVTPTKGSQAVGMMVSPATALTTSLANRTPTVSTDNGFVGGLVLKNETTPSVYYNQSASQVAFTKASNGNVGATFNLRDPGTNLMDVTFGTHGGGKSAFISNDMYAAQQSSVVYNTGAASATAGNNGALIASGQISNVTNKCTTCTYTQWGVWAGSKTDTNMGSSAKDVFNMVPYVTGQLTPSAYLDTASTTAVNYNNGAAYANVYDSTNNKLKNMQGSMSAVINLGNRTVDNLNIDLSASGGPTMSGYTPTAFTGNGFEITNLAGGGYSGSSRGALFGPNAEEVGGNFEFTNGTDITGAGIYHGAR